METIRNVVIEAVADGSNVVACPGISLNDLSWENQNNPQNIFWNHNWPFRCDWEQDFDKTKS